MPTWHTVKANAKFLADSDFDSDANNCDASMMCYKHIFTRSIKTNRNQSFETLNGTTPKLSSLNTCLGTEYLLLSPPTSLAIALTNHSTVNNRLMYSW